MENQRQSESKKYYIPLPKTADAPTGYIEFFRDFQFVEVSEEVYRTYYQPIWKTWKYAKRHGTCTGEDWKRCLGDCVGCPCCHHLDDCISLDVIVDDSEQTTIADTIADPTPLIDEVMVHNAALEELLNALQELDPDGRRIGELLLQGKSKYDISKIINIGTSTFYKRFDRLKEHLRQYLEKKI